MADRDPITLMAEAVEARLRLYFLPERWFFEIVPDPLTVDEFRSVTGNTPLLALSWRQFTPQAPAARGFKGQIGLRLTIVVKNSSRRASRFLGDARGPGLFPALCTAMTGLNGHTVAGLGTILVSAAAQAMPAWRSPPSISTCWCPCRTSPAKSPARLISCAC